MTYSMQLGLNKTKEALAQQCSQESKNAHYKADLEIEWSPAPPKLTFNLGHMLHLAHSKTLLVRGYQ